MQWLIDAIRAGVRSGGLIGVLLGALMGAMVGAGLLDVADVCGPPGALPALLSK